MGKFLADTTVLVEHLRGNKDAIDYLLQESPYVSQVTVVELIQGTKNKVHLQSVEQVIEDLQILPIEASYSTLALRLMKQFFHAYHLVFLDAIIAATAIESRLTLVTSNIKHFSFIKELNLLDWKEVK